MAINNTNRCVVTDKDTGQAASVNTEGRQDFVQHAHPGNGWVHFDTGTISASQDYILLDISDTTNYPHSSGSYVHLEFVRIHTDASSNADYYIQVGFLNNVDATDGDFYVLFDVHGDNIIGRSVDHEMTFYPNGPRASLEFLATGEKSLNDVAFQTDVNLASTLDATTANVPSGSGDLVVRVIVNAGSVDTSVELSYHTH